MKSDQVIAALSAFIAGDRDHGIAVTRQIAASESRGGRTTVARRLEQILRNKLVRLPGGPSGVDFFEPPTETPVLSESAEASLFRLLREWEHKEALADRGLAPASSLLLHGPSGNGKTMTAGWLASKLQLPFGLVDYGVAVDSHLGATGSNLSKIMRHARTTPCLLFFDVADSILTRRSTSGSAASRESNRIVNQVLMELDQFGCNSLAVFATNFPELDSALIRRIEVQVELSPPGKDELRNYAIAIASQWKLVEEGKWLDKAIAAAKSFAECKSIVASAAKGAVLESCSAE